MTATLTDQDYELLLDALKHSRLAFERTEYPGSLKEQKLAHVDAVRDKLQHLRRAAPAP